MKCIKRGDEFRRVSGEEASSLTKKGWQYVSKNEYKRNRSKENEGNQ